MGRLLFETSDDYKNEGGGKSGDPSVHQPLVELAHVISALESALPEKEPPKLLRKKAKMILSWENVLGGFIVFGSVRYTVP